MIAIVRTRTLRALRTSLGEAEAASAAARAECEQHHKEGARATDSAIRAETALEELRAVLAPGHRGSLAHPAAPPRRDSGVSVVPVYRWRLAPEGYATRRQLRALGLRPGGQDVVAQIERPRRRRGPLVAYLYSIEQALPVRPMTPAKWAALAAANLARRTCPACGRDAGYTIPTSLGTCVPCADAPQLAA